MIQTQHILLVILFVLTPLTAYWISYVGSLPVFLIGLMLTIRMSLKLQAKLINVAVMLNL
jgi:hypothetical protein